VIDNRSKDYRKGWLAVGKMSDKEINDLAVMIAEILNSRSQIISTGASVKKLYVIFGNTWKNSYYSLFEELSTLDGFSCTAVIPDAVYEPELEMKIKGFDGWDQVLTGKGAPDPAAEDSIYLFLEGTRNLIGKTALGICDTPDTIWLISALEQGVKAVILKGGLERFTGKEPKAYVKRILDYHRILLEYGIGMIDSVKELNGGSV